MGIDVGEVEENVDVEEADTGIDEAVREGTEIDEEVGVVEVVETCRRVVDDVPVGSVG